jgi:photosystem II stability/assembly factor-like uncharacterized protein
MEPDAASRLTARKRRALGLIAFSLIALAAASLTWIVPGLRESSKATGATPASQTPSPLPIYPSAYEFATISTGWAVLARPAETRVFNTADGGKHWKPSGRFAGSYGATIQFLDTTHGFVVATNPQHVYRTTDGGAHWTEIVMPEDRAYYMTFTDRRRGSVLGPSRPPNPVPVIYTTDDGGDTWRRLPDPPADSYGSVFRNSEAWLSATSSGPPHVYTSYDGGVSWIKVDLPRPPGPASTGPTYANAQVTVLPGAGVTVAVLVGPSCGKPAPCPSSDAAQFVSFDRGNTWTSIPQPPPAFNYRDIVYQDAQHWWAIGSGSLFKSSNAGQTWQQISTATPLPPPPPQFVLHVIDSQHAWVELSMLMSATGGANYRMSTVIVTGDGGLTWTRVTPPKITQT